MWLCAGLVVGCGANAAGPDAQQLGDAVTTDGPGLSDGPSDVADRDQGAVDAAAVDLPPTDASSTDVPRIDALVADAPRVDAPPVDGVGVDVTSSDAARTDAATPVVDAGLRDATADGGGADVPRDGGASDAPCTGAAPTVTVTAPSAGQVIETCTASDSPVSFDFVAAVAASASVASVDARWITPDGAEAPPPATLRAAPYAFRRQVGGPSSGVPALSVFGIRGDWRVEFTAIDACGRRAVASQTFSLTYNPRRCPNP